MTGHYTADEHSSIVETVTIDGEDVTHAAYEVFEGEDGMVKLFKMPIEVGPDHRPKTEVRHGNVQVTLRE